MVYEARRKEKKERILEAAAQVFAMRGYSGTLVADIAVQAGVGKGTVYEYFDSKEDLFFAVFEWFVQATEAKAKISISALGGSASHRLSALSDSLMQSWDEMKDMYSLVMEFWSASASSQMRERFKLAFKQGYKDFRQIVSSLIRDGIERGEFRPEVDAESVAAALVGTWDALLLQAWFDEDFDHLRAAKRFMEALISGLASKPQLD
ncbi:MAG: TetR/AcrR family transcriptional regulator [Deltaproteobacteria bacterium]|nr:MAG: TetR/AcrR family transcriptional regulator [Deltaproteobacteria bacterium]